jgi:hypothetical protein
MPTSLEIESMSLTLSSMVMQHLARHRRDPLMQQSGRHAPAPSAKRGPARSGITVVVGVGDSMPPCVQRILWERRLHMKRLLIIAMVTAGATSALAADVGVSVQVGQPGFYGRIDVGNFPPPLVVYPEPVIIQPVPVGVVRQPIYLHVPPGHAKNWRKHCGKYNACGQPVYFVQEDWYNDVYVPRYREGKSHGQGKED